MKNVTFCHWKARVRWATILAGWFAHPRRSAYATDLFCLDSP